MNNQNNQTLGNKLGNAGQKLGQIQDIEFVEVPANLVKVGDSAAKPIHKPLAAPSKIVLLAGRIYAQMPSITFSEFFYTLVLLVGSVLKVIAALLFLFLAFLYYAFANLAAWLWSKAMAKQAVELSDNGTSDAPPQTTTEQTNADGNIYITHNYFFKK